MTTLTETQTDKIRVATSKAVNLPDTLKFIIKIPGTDKLPEYSFKNIETIISETPKQAFWEKWSPLEGEKTTKEGFFAHYVRRSTLKYKPTKYDDSIEFLSHWLNEMQLLLNFPRLSIPLESQHAWEALFDI